MDLQLLIDSIVRQTTVLIAQLATAGGARAPLARLADQVFLELADELHAQGVSRKVSADMFGIALRSYLRRIQRLRESSTERGRSLWEAVLERTSQGSLVSRGEILRHFRHDDPVQVGAVLHDLCDSGLLLRLGSGDAACYRAATEQELAGLDESGGPGAEALLWALIYREGPLSGEALERRVSGAWLPAALERLLAEGRIEAAERGADTVYSAGQFFVPVGASVGWEAAIFDHFQALVKTIAARLAHGEGAADDRTGGSTYGFEVWPGHPLRDEVVGELGELRARMSELRRRVRAYNAGCARPASYEDVTFYAGQCVTVEGDEEGEGHV